MHSKSSDRPHGPDSYDSGYEHSIERMVEVRRMVARADSENHFSKMPSRETTDYTNPRYDRRAQA